MSYPPGPDNPYGQQPPQGQPGPSYGYPQQPPAQPYGHPPQQPGFPQQQGYPQQPPAHPQQQPGYPGAPSQPPGGGYGQPAGAYGQPGGVPGTPQGMPPFASWGARVGAYLVDFMIVGFVPVILITIGYVQMIGSAVQSINDCAPGDKACINAAASSASQGSGGAFALIAIGGLLGLAATLWLLYKEGTTGQTPGKKTLKISVLREADGRPLGFGMAFVRRLCHALDGMACYIGFLWPLWDQKKQTFADKIVSSVVVRTG